MIQSKPQLVQNMSLPHAKYIPKQSQDIPQSKVLLEISLLERYEAQSKPSMVQNVSLPLDTPNPPQITAQPQLSSEMLFLDRSNTKGTLITTTHANYGEILKLKAKYRESIHDMRKAILPYIDPLCRPPPRTPDIAFLRFPRKLPDLDMGINMDTF